jgi:3-oxoacid CoA-transferase subunit A
MMATAGKVCIAEVEEIHEVGQLEADQIHTPSIFVDKLLLGPKYEKRIERATTRPRA